jgi:hypothetical protein
LRLPSAVLYPAVSLASSGRLMGMRPAPDFLPSANSRKWHNRRWWDSLGYLRVRTLTDPAWSRDVQWLVGVLDRKRPTSPGPERSQYDRAVARLRTCGAASRRGSESESAFHDRSEALWDDFLEALDGYLKLIQDRHLRDVDEAGVSGR